MTLTTKDAETLAEALGKSRMMPYDDGEGGTLWRAAMAVEQAQALIASGAVRREAEVRAFTADEVVQIANETSDSFGNLYRLDFIDRIRHEAALAEEGDRG